jgi:hypothetical protein
MVSRRARRRHSKEMSNDVNTKPVMYFPRFYWLFEHDERKTVIRVPTLEDLQQVQEMMRRGNAMCNHQDKLGECICIEPATINDWLDTHPGT